MKTLQKLMNNRWTSFIIIVPLMVISLTGITLSQSSQQVAFNFTGITDCGNEATYNTPSTVGEAVDNSIAIKWERLSVGTAPTPVCEQTSGTNNMFNSKCWSEGASYDAANSSYLRLFYRLKSGRYFTDGTQIQIDITLKRYGNGPNLGFLRLRFVDVYDDNGAIRGTPIYATWNPTSDWNFTNSSTQILSFNSGGNGAFIPPDNSNYDAVEVEIHGWSAGNCNGQGSSLALDEIAVSHPDPLPVELVSFSSQTAGKAVILKWKTATEINNYGFEIERSLNNKTWKNIGFVEGQGTSNAVTEYAFTDQNAASLGNKLYYRLKQIDRDGSYDYSPTILANFAPINKSFGIYAAYPNPFNPTTTMNYFVPSASRVSLKLFNTLGQEVVSVLENEFRDAGQHSVMIDASKLSSGTYFARLTSSNITSVYKLILNR